MNDTIKRNRLVEKLSKRINFSHLPIIYGEHGEHGELQVSLVVDGSRTTKNKQAKLFKNLYKLNLSGSFQL